MLRNVDGIGSNWLATDDTRQIQYGTQCSLSVDIEIGWKKILGALHSQFGAFVFHIQNRLALVANVELFFKRYNFQIASDCAKSYSSINKAKIHNKTKNKDKDTRKVVDLLL